MAYKIYKTIVSSKLNKLKKGGNITLVEEINWSSVVSGKHSSVIFDYFKSF